MFHDLGCRSIETGFWRILIKFGHRLPIVSPAVYLHFNDFNGKLNFRVTQLRILKSKNIPVGPQSRIEVNQYRARGS